MSGMDIIWIIVIAAAAVGAALYWARRLGGRATAQYEEARAERDEARSQHERVRQEHDQVKLRTAELTATLQERTSRLQEVRAERDEAISQRERVRRELEETKSELSAEKADHQARSEELAKAREQIDTQFKAIAADVVNTSSEAFLKRAGEQFDSQRKLNDSDLEKRQQAIDNIVRPVGETLDRFQKQVGEIETKREGAYKSLDTQLGLLREETVNLRDVTGNLSEAMKSSQVRGQWGEQQLRRVLELSGLREHISYDAQRTADIEDDTGKTRVVRPDAVVKVPGGVEVVIDSKAPMGSYLEACNLKARSGDAEKRQAELLAKHAESLLGHAKSLGDKEYTSGFAGSPDFTVMFVPSDPILDVAMDAKPTLWDDAWAKHRVLIATPGLLLAFLRTVALAWQQQSLQKNAREIAEQATKLYDSLRIYAGHVTNVGKNLGRAVEAYNSSVGSLEGRLLPRARKFEKLGPAESLTKKVESPVQVGSTPRTTTAPELTL